MRRRALAALSAVVLTSVMLGGTALAASVDPVLVDGNPVCSGSGGPSGPSLGFDYGIKIDPPKEGTFALGAGTVTVSDIDTSVNPATFTWSSSGVTVLAVIVKGGPAANVYYYNPPASSGDSGLHAPNGFSHINFCYDDAQMPGTLKVKKVVEGGPEGFEGTFPVTVDCGDGGTYTGDISYPNTGYRTFIDLPAGAECTVTEGTLPAAPDGYEWGDPSYTGNPATIKEDGKSYVTVTNHLSLIPPPETGSLKITKDISGGPGEIGGSFDVTVDCGEAGTFHRTITVPDPGEVTIDGIDAGAVCTVDEDIIQEDPPLGWHWSTPILVGNPATIVSGQTVTIDVTNTLVRKPGSIEIRKTVVGAPEGFSGSFDITVDCGAQDFSGTIQYPSPGFLTFTGVDIDATCTVTEVGTSAAPAGFEWGDVTYTNNPTTVPGGEITIVGITNTLEEIPPPEVGSLKITKDIPGVPEGFVGSFGVRASCTDIDPIDATIEFPDPGFITIDDLPAGAICAVIETSRSDPPEGFEWAGPLFAGTATIVAGQTAEVTVTNLLTEQQGTPVLTIEKSNDSADPTFEGVIVTYQLDYTVSDDEPVSGAVIKDVLPVGVTYVAGTATNSAGDAFVFDGYDATTRTLTWLAPADISVNGSVGYQVTIDDGAAGIPQPLTNTACIDSDETEEDCDSSDVLVAEPPLVETHKPTGPPTDIAGTTTDSTTSSGSMLLVLLGLVGLVGAVVTVAPVPASIRRRKP